MVHHYGTEHCLSYFRSLLFYSGVAIATLFRGKSSEYFEFKFQNAQTASLANLRKVNPAR
ncbi:hypothetical protein BDW60DRAFT_180189 [Aspergillus nidulans var. acristatus]